jgi:hypothetical protein
MSDERERRVSGRRSRRRSGIADLAFAFPMAFTESLTERYGASLPRGRLDSADILEMLGDNEAERVASVVAILRKSSDEDIRQFMRIGQMAVAQVSEERAREQTRGR